MSDQWQVQLCISSGCSASLIFGGVTTLDVLDFSVLKFVSMTSDTGRPISTKLYRIDQCQVLLCI